MTLFIKGSRLSFDLFLGMNLLQMCLHRELKKEARSNRPRSSNFLSGVVFKNQKDFLYQVWKLFNPNVELSVKVEKFWI